MKIIWSNAVRVAILAGIGGAFIWIGKMFIIFGSVFICWYWLDS